MTEEQSPPRIWISGGHRWVGNIWLSEAPAAAPCVWTEYVRHDLAPPPCGSQQEALSLQGSHQVADDRFDFIVDALAEHYGPRCPDYAEGCPSCDAWTQYDRLRRFALPEPGSEAEKAALARMENAIRTYLSIAEPSPEYLANAALRALRGGADG